jgi:hypothetical protein
VTPVLRIASPYRGLDTYAHIHRYLGERVVCLWLVEMYKSRRDQAIVSLTVVNVDASVFF